MIRYLVPIGFILILLFSNPDFNFHKNQISEKISNNLDDTVLEDLAKMLTSFSMDYLKILKFNDYNILSFTTFKFGDKTAVLSIGLLGNVFVFNDEIENSISKFAYDFKKNYDEKNLRALKKIEKKIERRKKDEKEFFDDLKNQIEDKKRKTNKRLEELKREVKSKND
jgi:hypothetical protein